MKEQVEMQLLSSKLDDLKNVFKIGEKIIPGIQKLIDFMVEIVPLLNNINTSIHESYKKIPKASDQIIDVTSANEIATTEILDRVDEISIEIEFSQKAYVEFANRYAKIHNMIEQVKSVVGDNPTALGLLKEIDDLNSTQEYRAILETSISRIKSNLEKITITLQVQDITAQQLSAVNHLIGSVQKKLSSLILDLNESEVNVNKEFGVLVENHTPEILHFDPEASFTKTNNAQALVDELINNKRSQNNTDRLLYKNGK
ncbi:MAG: hypothetical protein CVV23_15385 [Ignavibacteriae bacterium HGW-Ignavibacteriae-2]|jgi:chemotaxis regulatin CheY-phosphate phosphatase CheZ|nr:hypothetical protein [Bacteroidota bacterium]PKL87424.1 MAG: hypothetical protein CVV23_15385 [Ignavibacteriae bacterium HGW-Ignavibacteriae-2]